MREERSNISFTCWKQDYNSSSGYRWKLSLKKKKKPWRVSAWMVQPHAATRDHELRFKRDTATKTVTVKLKGSENQPGS